MTEQQLLDLKKKVENAKDSVNKHNGEKIALLKQLKKDWNCDTIEQGKNKLEKLEERITKLEERIEKNIEKLKEDYNIEI